MNIKGFIIICLAAFAFNVSASEYSEDKDEGDLSFKVRGFLLHTKATNKSPSVPVPNNVKLDSLAKFGYGADAATTYFVSRYMAVELGLGIGIINLSKSALEQIQKAYGVTSNQEIKKNQMYYMPASCALQYHMAPFGGIRPYVSAGYHVGFMYTKSNSIKSHASYGPIIQAGISFVARDDTMFNIEVKKFFSRSKVNYKQGFLGPDSKGQEISSRVTWNPLIVSAGIGFKF